MNTSELDKRASEENAQVEKLFFSLSKEGILLNANQQFCRMLDSDIDLVIGTPVWNFIHEDDRPLFIQRIAESFERNLIPFTFRFSDIEDNHQSFCVNSCKKISKNEMYIQAISIVNSSEYISDEELLFEDIANNLELGIFQYDAKKNKFLYVSPAMEGLLGVKNADMLRDPRKFISNLHADDIKEILQLSKGLSKGRKDVEYRVLHKGDEIRWLRTTFTPILDEADLISRYFAITRDITKQKLQDELLLKWDKLDIVGHLAASFAHHIRNPLTTIKGFIQLLELENDKRYTTIISEEVRAIESMVEEFLQLAKPSSTTEFSIASIQDNITRSVSLMKREATIQNITFQVFFCDEDAFIRCESKQIQQVFMNIIKNSIEAMPNGGFIEIRTAIEEGDLVKITIADTGRGMSLERLQKLGEPFYSQKEKGTSLGLMVSYKIIEYHNGTIQFTSEEGVGTTVEIRLPIINPS